MTPTQRNAYQLAENLGMTVTRMMSEMTVSEFYGWMAFYAEQAAEERLNKVKSRPAKDGEVIIRGFDI